MCFFFHLSLFFSLGQSAVVDLKTKEEKDAELDKRIEALRKKNEALVKRYQVNLTWVPKSDTPLPLCQFVYLVYR